MKKIIIIGAGISGLSSGIFAQSAGFETSIYEMHNIPGGECTGWSRKGYHFDNCIHWLTGTKENTDLYKLWEFTGALDSVEILQKDTIFSVALDGTVLHFYRDINKLEEHLKNISPEDSENIDEVIEIIKAFESIKIPSKKPFDQMNILDFIKLGKEYKGVNKFIKKLNEMNMGEYASKFKSEIIRVALNSFTPRNYSAFSFFVSIATITSGNGGWPKGGSLNMAIRMEKKYKSLGGKVYYNSKVKKIIIKNNIAEGIELENGEIILADIIISAGDGVKLINDLLQNKYRDEYFDTALGNIDNYPTHSSIDISLGVKCDLSNRPHTATFRIEPIRIGNDIVTEIGLKHYCYEKEFSTEGASVLKTTIITQEYKYFKELYEMGYEHYLFEKDRIANEVIRRIEDIYYEIKGRVEVVDVTTPLTYERYCNAYMGAWMGFDLIPRVKTIRSTGKIKGIEGLYLAGQWLLIPGGLPTALLSGKWAVQRICKDEKLKFPLDY